MEYILYPLNPKLPNNVIILKFVKKIVNKYVKQNMICIFEMVIESVYINKSTMFNNKKIV